MGYRNKIKNDYIKCYFTRKIHTKKESKSNLAIPFLKLYIYIHQPVMLIKS